MRRLSLAVLALMGLTACSSSRSRRRAARPPALGDGLLVVGVTDGQLLAVGA